jgi:drug/metabolite transporter (DMT)-like permease
MNKTTVKIHLALITVSTIFGVNTVTSKIALREINPYALVFFRVSIAAVLLYIVHRFLVKEIIQSASDYIKLAWFSVFGIVINQTLFLKGLALTTAINAAVLVTSIPVITILIAMFLKKEKTSLWKIVGAVISLSGVLFLFGVDRIDFSNQYFVGNLLIFINGTSYALYLVITKDILKRYNPLTVTTWTFIFGSVGVFPFTIHTASETAFGEISIAAYLCIAFLILFASVIVYYINSWALQHTTSSMVAMYIYIQPVIATVVSIFLLDEPIQWGTLISAVMIFSGVFLVGKMTQREKLSEKEKESGYLQDSAMRLED